MQAHLSFILQLSILSHRLSSSYLLPVQFCSHSRCMTHIAVMIAMNASLACLGVHVWLIGRYLMLQVDWCASRLPIFPLSTYSLSGIGAHRFAINKMQLCGTLLKTGSSQQCCCWGAPSPCTLPWTVTNWLLSPLTSIRSCELT